MSNSLKAFTNLIENLNFIVEDNSESGNRMNAQGIAFEKYVEKIFCGNKKFEDVFIFKGDANHPPDFMLKDKGDAIEVKKHESGKTSTTKSDIALNSSHPRSFLYSTDDKITDKCIDCEAWDKRDMLYIVGSIDKSSSKIEYVWFVYGDCIAADKEYYKKIEETIKDILKKNNIQNIVIEADGNELGKLKSIDPLEITDLRIRGMYGLTNPYKLFQDIIKDDDSNLISDFETKIQNKKIEIKEWNKNSSISKKTLNNELKILNENKKNHLIIEKNKTKVFFLSTQEKYDTFPNKDKEKIHELSELLKNRLNYNKVVIKNPNDLTPLDAILIKYSS